jgi:phage-related minor tail protein
MINTKINIDFSQVTKGFNNLEKDVKDIGKDIKLNIDTKEASGKLKNMFEDVKSSLSGAFDLSQIMNFSAGGLVTGAVEGAISGIVAGFSSAIEKGNEFNNALLDLQAKTGATASEMKVLEQSAKDLFIGGVGESVAEATKIMGEAQIRLGSVFSGKELTDFTAKANALGKQYDLDVNEVIKKSAPFIKQYGLSGEEAFNLVAMSMKEGATASDDILDSLAEYSQLTKNAGYSAEQFTDILTRGAKEGIFNTDKLADSIKEAEIRIKAGDFATAFKDISAGANSVQKPIIEAINGIVKAGQSGELSIQETLQKSTSMIDKAFKEGKISESLASQLQVAVAGTPAEDIGTELFGKIFGAPIDEQAVQARAKTIGDNLSKAVGQYTTLDSLSRAFEVAITDAGKSIVTFTDDILKFLTPFFEFYEKVFNATTLTLYGNIFSTVFGIIKKTIMDTYNSVKQIVDIFASMFGEAKSGIDIFKILSTVFEVLGRIIGTALTIPFQALHKIIQAFLFIIKEVILFVKSLGDRFNEFVKSNKMVSEFVEAITKRFKQLGEFISETAGKVKGFLQTLGLLSKDKPLKETAEDTKKITENVTETNNELDKSPPKIEKQKVAVKTLQQQYDELYQATLKLAQKQDFGSQYDKNIIKLRELEAKLQDVKDASKQVKFDILGTADFEITEIKNKSSIQIRPEKLTLKPFTPIKIEGEVGSETAIELAKSLTKGLSDIKYTSIFKKKEIEFDKSLDNDRQNLLSSLQKNELSYEEYANRLNEIDSQRNETAKQKNSEFVNDLNNGLSKSFETMVEFSKNAVSMQTSKLSEIEINTTSLFDNVSENVGNAFLLIGSATAQMAVEGENVLKSLVKNVIKAARLMMNAYLAVLLPKANIERPLGLGTIEWAAIGIGANALLSLAEASFKDGVIDLKGKGTGTSDSILARVSNGESVINARSTKENKRYLEFINNGGKVGDLISMNNAISTRRMESLLMTNNNLLQNKNLVSNVNVNNQIQVANSGISVKFKR